MGERVLFLQNRIFEAGIQNNYQYIFYINSTSIPITPSSRTNASNNFISFPFIKFIFFQFESLFQISTEIMPNCLATLIPSKKEIHL